MYQVDVNQEYQKAKSKFLRYSLLFSFMFAAILTADTLLILLAGEDYQINLIITICISILFLWFAIYFFTNIYQDINNKYRYFKGYDSGIKPTDEVIFLEYSDEIAYVNGLYVYPIIVKYVSNLAGTDKIIYSFDNHFDLKEGDKLTFTTYQRIVLKMEKHS
jgi:hypothetical protein